MLLKFEAKAEAEARGYEAETEAKIWPWGQFCLNALTFMMFGLIKSALRHYLPAPDSSSSMTYKVQTHRSTRHWRQSM